MIFTVDKVVENHLPKLNQNPWLARPAKAVLRYLLNEKKCHEITQDIVHLEGIEFVESLVNNFNFSCNVDSNELNNIPSEGRVIIFANHPIGSLDALALVNVISKRRPDIKVVVNEVLMALEPLRSISLPVRTMTGGTPKQHVKEIHQHLKSHGALLIFPSGEVSRLSPSGIRDTQWQNSFIKIARSCNAPLLPVFIHARNSASFYGASMIYKPLATLLLVKELFKQTGGTMDITIGEVIPVTQIYQSKHSLVSCVSKLKQHLYSIGKKHSGIFTTYSPVATPESATDLQSALKKCECLGSTQDNKLIYLFEHQGGDASDNIIMREVGRLREIAFRSVGEGTGKAYDIDQYDDYYQHLILWDDATLEIVGAYRFASTKILAERKINKGLYSETLFNYTPEFKPYFDEGLELGRSFVQLKYQGKRSLYYLWYGIAAYLKKYPHCRYLFGPVSISHELSQKAKDILVHFYDRQFPSPVKLAESNSPFVLTAERKAILDRQYEGLDYQANFKILRTNLLKVGSFVPTLYKQYGELCHPGGVKFMAFGVDNSFGDCIDGLILVDLQKLTPLILNRYFPEQSQPKT